jgi:hypothetical protein
MNKAHEARKFECAVCHRRFKGWQQLIDDRYVWTPFRHSVPYGGNLSRCLGSQQPAIIADPKFAASLPKRRGPADEREEALASCDGKDRELLEFLFANEKAGLSPLDNLFAKVKKLIEIYTGEQAERANRPEMLRFRAWLEQRGFILRPWQEAAAAQVLTQPGAAGKTFLLQLLTEYDREGNG